MYKELVEYIVKSLVAFPDKVEVQVEQKGDRQVLKIKVEQTDMGRIIGKEGRIIRSIREIIHAYSSKANEKVSVDVID